MTLVLRISLPGASFLLGDVLVSGEGDSNITLPTVGDVCNVFPKGSGWTVKWLKKKTAILGNNIIVAWFGTEVVARIVIHKLEELNSHHQMSAEQISEFFTDENIRDILDNFDADGFGFTGFVVEGDSVSPFEYMKNCQHRELTLPNNLGNLRFYGSGGDQSFGVLSELKDRLTEDIESCAVDVSRLVHNLFLVISSGLLLEEILTHEPLHYYFGALYDFVAFSGNQVLPQHECTYFFWEVTWGTLGEPQVTFHSKGIKMKHLENQVIECLSWDKPPSSEIIKAQLYHIQSMVTSYEFMEQLNQSPLSRKTYDLNSEYSCHLIVVRSPDGNGEKDARLHCIFKGAQPVSIENLDTELKYNFDEKIFEWIKSSSRKLFA